MAAMARNPSGMMVELTASRPAHGDKVYLSRTRSTSCTSRKASRRSLDHLPITCLTLTAVSSLRHMYSSCLLVSAKETRLTMASLSNGALARVAASLVSCEGAAKDPTPAPVTAAPTIEWSRANLDELK